MKALVISTASPDATSENQTGSTNWNLRLLRLLSRNHDITLLAPPPLTDPFFPKADLKKVECEPDDRSGKCSRFIKSLTWKIYPSMWHQRSSKILQFLSQETADAFDVCWLLDDYAGMYLRELPPELPVVFCRHFVLNMGLAEGDPRSSWALLRLAWHRWIAKSFDKWTTQRANITITGTNESQANIKALAPESIVEYFPTKPYKIPKMVSLDTIGKCSENGRIQILYVGDMSFIRNEEGVRWFLTKVLAGLDERTLKRIHFRFIGRKPSKSVMTLPVPEHSSIVFRGFAKDLEHEIQNSQGAIIPVFGGNGVRIKTVNLIGAGLPTVSTSDGIEGLPVISQQDVIVANDSKEFGKGISRLLDVDCRQHLSKNCISTMSSFLSEKKDADRLYALSKMSVKSDTIVK
jgi:hypothetical protein